MNVQTIYDNIVSVVISDMLKIINKNYPDKFKLQNIANELEYIKKHVSYCKKTNKVIINVSKPEITNVMSNTLKVNTLKVNTLKVNKINKVKPIQIQKQISDNKCSARVWHDGIFTKSMKIVEIIDDKFIVDDYNDINIEDFTKKFILGLRCKNNKIDNFKYCKKHNKHLIHGDYLKIPSKELCYHFMKDGKYL